MEKIDKKEIGISALKILISAIPLPCVSQALAEVIDYRGKIKQNRLNKFVELFSEFFYNNPSIELENLKSEDFSDLFESVLKRVVLTKSEEKHKRLRDVLAKQIIKPNTNIDNSEIFLDLISTLSETEISVLYHYSNFNKDLAVTKQNIRNFERNLERAEEELKVEGSLRNRGYDNQYSSINYEISRIKENLHNERQIIEENQKLRGSNFINITEDQLLFYKQRLYSKGLLIDSGIGGIGIQPFQIMSITQFGRQFINFIVNEV